MCLCLQIIFNNFGDTCIQLVAMLHGCSVAICDKIKQSAEGAIQAVVEFVTRRGSELTEIDISRFKA